jgi:hypothetical protein
MNFLNPWFFVGALAASVPVLLHLIRRERAHRIEFPTLMFLRRISKKTIRYQKLRHLLLLLLRVLAFLLIALAFTRPFREIVTAAISGGRPTVAHIILIDNSMSMAYGDRLGRAKSAAQDILRKAQVGDKVAILAFSDRTAALTGLTTDVRQAVAQVESGIQITDYPTRYGQALGIAERLGLDAGTGRRVIHLISDFQKNGAWGEEQVFRLGPGTELERIDLGSDEYSNLAIGDVRILDTEENAGGKLNIKASVVNFGSRDRKNVRATLSVDGRTVSEKMVDSLKGQVQAVEFQLPGLTSGLHSLVLAVDDPEFTPDNKFYVMMQSRGKTPVLAVENPGSAKGPRAPSFFLSNALNLAAFSPYSLTAVSPQQLESMKSLSGIVVWNNASGAGEAIQKKIQSFVRSGGGLIVVVSDAGMAAEFNRSFGSWLPVKVEEVAPAQRRSALEDYALLTDIKMDFPVFQPFAQPHSGNFSSARFFDHAKLKVDKGAEVPARFDNGDPALVSASVDKGRVLVFASSADDSTNDLPVKAVYAPFWQQMLRYLGNFEEKRHWMQVGDTVSPKNLLVSASLEQAKGGADLNEAIALLDPAKQRVPIPQGADIVALDKAGFYELRTASMNSLIAVNPASRESDLTHGNSEEMTAAWQSPDAKAAPVISEDEKLAPEEQERTQRFWRFLLLGALVFLIAEGLLSNRAILKTQ